MSDKSKIEWTEATWNPIAGCSIVSKGCTNCYAMKVAARLEAMGQAKYAGLTKPSKAGPVWTGKISVADDGPLTQPLRWKLGRRIFVNSMSDLFHEGVSDETIDTVFSVMALSPQHTFQVLTKRPERMRAYMKVSLVPRHDGPEKFDWPLPNVWLGVSVEDQATADERIPILLDTPAAVRWISAEPLLGPVTLTKWHAFHRKDAPSWQPTLDWVVAGGESGPNARPMHPDWVRSIRDQCAAAGVPFLFKQWGEHLPVYDRQRDDPDWRRCDEVARSTPRGQWLNLAGGQGFHGECVVRIDRVGKHAAGRTLDGRIHDEYPR